jgi:hypothetical protein
MVCGVDHVNHMQKGTVDDVKRATLETMEIAKPGGGAIVQSADFLEYDTPVENVQAFVDTAIEHASY